MTDCPNCGKEYKTISEFPRVRVLGIQTTTLPESVHLDDSEFYGYGWILDTCSLPLNKAVKKHAKDRGLLGQEFEHNGITYKPLGKRKIYTASLNVTPEFRTAFRLGGFQDYLSQLEELKKTQCPVSFNKLKFLAKSVTEISRNNGISLSPILIEGYLNGRQADVDVAVRVKSLYGTYETEDVSLGVLRLEGILNQSN